MLLYGFLTQQLSNKGPNYVSQINLSNMAPNPPKMPRGATHGFYHQPFVVLPMISIAKYLTFGKNSDNKEKESP